MDDPIDVNDHGYVKTRCSKWILGVTIPTRFAGDRMRRFVEAIDRGKARCFLNAWKTVGGDNPARVIDVFVEELDLAALGFSGGRA